MMESDQIISGIYDLKTLKTVLESDVDAVCFDMRPLSLSFVQSYKFSEFIPHLKGTDIIVYFIFENEKDFVVNELLKFCIDGGLRRSQIRVVFSGREGKSYLENINFPIFLYLTPENQKLSGLQNLEGYFLRESDLLEVDNLSRYFSNLMMRFQRPISFKIHIDWSSSTLNFEELSFFGASKVLTIGKEVEICYRNVHQERLRELL